MNLQTTIIASLISLLLGGSIGMAATAKYLDDKHALQTSQAVTSAVKLENSAQVQLISKTQQATVITTDNTAKLSQDLQDANNKISTLQHGIANGTIGMHVSILNPNASPVLQSTTNTSPVPKYVDAQLDPAVATSLTDITNTGDQYAIKYNSLLDWCSKQIAETNK